MTLSARIIDRTKPPHTPDLPVFKLPAVFETSLPNGLEVVLVEDRRFPLVSARLGFQAGSKYDLQDLAGLSESAGALLTEGTASRTAREYSTAGKRPSTRQAPNSGSGLTPTII